MIEKLLYSYQDLNYQAFQKKLIKTKYPIIGVRLPILSKIIKQMSSQETFMKEKHTFYEEIMIHGYLINEQKSNFVELCQQLESFFPYIDNWSINDSVCAHLKRWKQYQIEGYPIIESYLKDKNPWKVRFGLTLLLNYYLQKNNIPKILNLIKQIKSQNYYVQMGEAWLLSMCYLKDKKRVILFLQQEKIDIYTIKKTIQKIKDSNQVSKEEKEQLCTIFAK